MVAMGYDPRSGVSRLSTSISSCHLMITKGPLGLNDSRGLALGEGFVEAKTCRQSRWSEGSASREEQHVQRLRHRRELVHLGSHRASIDLRSNPPEEHLGSLGQEFGVPSEQGGLWSDGCISRTPLAASEPGLGGWSWHVSRSSVWLRVEQTLQGTRGR